VNTLTRTTPAVTAALFETDAYKLGHRALYPAGTTGILSNYTNRGSRIEGVNHVVHFGLQAFLQSYCIDAFAPFFAADEDEAVAEYESTLASILGPDHGIETDHIRALHQLGYLPLVFNSLPEGTRVPLRVPTLTVENTHPDFFWLVNYIETVLSAAIWHPSTSATIADHYRNILDAAAIHQDGDRAGVNWQLHDFSYRGMSGTEAAQASGAGHLLSFMGSDSLATIDWVNRYYPGDNGQILGSVPATEHSVMCAGIAEESEEATFERILDVHPKGIVSVVSDTFNLWTVLNSILPNLKDKILGRDGKLVIRPDSGDPADIICGTLQMNEEGYWVEPATGKVADREAHRTDREKGSIELLWEVFGGTINEAGLKVLDPHIGLIYGDSITPERAENIIDRLAAKGFAASNVVFGVGSYTYQYVTRDTFSSAVKATWALINGKEHNLLKDPVTDNGMKKSATGRLAVLRDRAGALYLVEQASAEAEAKSLLQPVWKDGKFLRTQSFADVRDTLGNLA